MRAFYAKGMTPAARSRRRVSYVNDPLNEPIYQVLGYTNKVNNLSEQNILLYNNIATCVAKDSIATCVIDSVAKDRV